MNKFSKWGVIGMVVLIVVIVAGFKIIQYQTKQYSPEERVQFAQGDALISVFYNRPFKKDREIFGKLVPYGKVWRTGANEATTFTTSKDLVIDGKSLPSGKYTIWTIPEPDSWTIIFNKKQYPWGVNFKGEASRDPDYDALLVKVLPEPLNESVEQFTISFDDGTSPVMVLVWDKTKVAIPMKIMG